MGCKRTPEPTASESEPVRSSDSVSHEAETDANVQAALASEGCKVRRQERRVFFVRCGDPGEDSSINLENLDELLQTVPTAEERRARTYQFIQRLTKDANLPEVLPLEKVVLVIRPENYIQASTESMGSGEAPPKIVSFPFPGNLIVLAAVDTSNNVALVPVSTLAQWKLDEAAVYAKAIEHFDAHPLTPKRVGAGDSPAVYRLSEAEDENEASRLLSSKSRASLEKVLGGRALFAIPDRRELLAAKADDARAVAALRALTSTYARGPLRITADLFEVDDQGKLRVAR
jgi:hypothetical protein